MESGAGFQGKETVRNISGGSSPLSHTTTRWNARLSRGFGSPFHMLPPRGATEVCPCHVANRLAQTIRLRRHRPKSAPKGRRRLLPPGRATRSSPTEERGARIWSHPASRAGLLYVVENLLRAIAISRSRRGGRPEALESPSRPQDRPAASALREDQGHTQVRAPGEWRSLLEETVHCAQAGGLRKRCKVSPAFGTHNTPSASRWANSSGRMLAGSR